MNPSVCLTMFFIIFLGTHCTVVPEPLDVTKMVFLPTPETDHLLVLTEFSSYAPWLPDTIKVHEEFGFEKEFVIDGLMLDSVSAGNLPTIKFVDANQNDVLRLRIDPSFSTLMIESDFNVRFIYFLCKGGFSHIMFFVYYSLNIF